MMKSRTTRSGCSAANALNPLFPVGGLANLIALLREQFADEGANVGVVVDNQDTLDRDIFLTRAIVSLSDRNMVGRAYRQSGSIALPTVPLPGSLSMRATPPDWSAMP